MELLSVAPYVLAFAQAAPTTKNDPIVVKIIEPPSDPTGLAEVLLGVVRLTGVWVVVAIVLGCGLAYGLFWLRSRPSNDA